MADPPERRQPARFAGGGKQEGLRADLEIARRHWRLIAGVILASVIVFAVAHERSAKTYTATASVAFQSDTLTDAALNIATVTSSEPQREADTEVLIAHSAEVAHSVRGQLKLSNTPDELLAEVKVEAAPTADVLNVLATTHDPNASAALANAFAGAVHRLSHQGPARRDLDRTGKAARTDRGAARDLGGTGDARAVARAARLAAGRRRERDQHHRARHAADEPERRRLVGGDRDRHPGRRGDCLLAGVPDRVARPAREDLGGLGARLRTAGARGDSAGQLARVRRRGLCPARALPDLAHRARLQRGHASAQHAAGDECRGRRGEDHGRCQSRPRGGAERTQDGARRARPAPPGEIRGDRPRRQGRRHDGHRRSSRGALAAGQAGGAAAEPARAAVGGPAPQSFGAARLRTRHGDADGTRGRGQHGDHRFAAAESGRRRAGAARQSGDRRRGRGGARGSHDPRGRASRSRDPRPSQGSAGRHRRDRCARSQPLRLQLV